MIFLTEEDVRQRCELGQGGEFRLQAGRTPDSGGHGAVAQSQLPRAPGPVSAPWKRRLSKKPNPRLPLRKRLRPLRPPNRPRSPMEPTLTPIRSSPSPTPRIFLRGKLDTLISSTVLVQTGFDGNNKLPAVLRNGLSDINVWLWRSSRPKSPAKPCPAQSPVRHERRSHPPRLPRSHEIPRPGPHRPDVALGPNVALLNWLRAQAREVEVAYVQVGMEREDILASLNRLSSAIYVLMAPDRRCRIRPRHQQGWSVMSVFERCLEKCRARERCRGLLRR